MMVYLQEWLCMTGLIFSRCPVSNFPRLEDSSVIVVIISWSLSESGDLCKLLLTCWRMNNPTSAWADWLTSGFTPFVFIWHQQEASWKQSDSAQPVCVFPQRPPVWLTNSVQTRRFCVQPHFPSSSQPVARVSEGALQKLRAWPLSQQTRVSNPNPPADGGMDKGGGEHLQHLLVSLFSLFWLVSTLE